MDIAFVGKTEPVTHVIIVSISGARQWAADPQHVSWVVIQMVAVRGLVALKLLLAARLLGPDLIGLVGIALLALAIVESLSDTGLSQAIIQRRAQIDGWEAGAVWSLQIARGAMLAIVLLATSLPIASFFKAPSAAALVALAAALPIIRNSFNPGLFLAQRDRNFRGVAALEGFVAAADLAVTLALVKLGVGAASMLIGTIVADCIKLIGTWTVFRFDVRPNLRWKRLGDLTSFGRWVWGSSVVTLVLNQLDKVLVARLLGTAEFGFYQVASRIAQMVVADGAVALGQYLYPTFAHRFRTSEAESRSFFQYVFVRIAFAATLIALVLAMLADTALVVALGKQWVPAADILRVLAFAMAVGAVIAVLVPYCRAIGRPKIVAVATSVQLLALVPLALVLTMAHRAMGMAVATLTAGLIAAIVMYQMSRRPHD